ncbi:MAG: hypothetical protein ACI3W6_00275, partial [Clostridia bacterium]
DAEAEGSNPFTPTIFFARIYPGGVEKPPKEMSIRPFFRIFIFFGGFLWKSIDLRRRFFI